MPFVPAKLGDVPNARSAERSELKNYEIDFVILWSIQRESCSHWLWYTASAASPFLHLAVWSR